MVFEVSTHSKLGYSSSKEKVCQGRGRGWGGGGVGVEGGGRGGRGGGWRVGGEGGGGWGYALRKHCCFSKIRIWNDFW